MLLVAQLVDLHQRRIYPAEIGISNGHISQIRELGQAPAGSGFIMPGFVDAHVHIESSMLPPSEFARMAVVHGTVATVSDPHEIANVLGLEGVDFMLRDAERVPLKFCFGAPSCVPATGFETAGAYMDAQVVAQLLARPDIGYLSEMMNFPGVLFNDPEVMSKIDAAQKLNKPVDGHAPGLRGEDAQRYFDAGISTDHECFTYEEGLEKAQLGIKILIREGSAAKNFEVLWPLLKEFPEQMMFCSDDKHPDDLVQGHINTLAARAIGYGCDLFDVLRAACINPVEHYRLKVGLARVGDPADFIIVENLTDFKVRETWIDGHQVVVNGQSLLPRLTCDAPNAFEAIKRSPEEFKLVHDGKSTEVRVIRVWDGQIVTGHERARINLGKDGQLIPNIEGDILYIAVLNRYVAQAPIAMGFVTGFGLTHGALASSVAHDSHNIVAIGTDRVSICAAVNAIIESKGGISATNGQGETKVLVLPIAGLMSQLDGHALAATYGAVDTWAKQRLGCQLSAPFMSLSFLALPVIPSLKMTDLGLFDVEQFGFVNVQ